MVTKIICAGSILLLAGCNQSFLADFGGEKIIVPVPDGYNTTSKLAPEFFKFMKVRHSGSEIVIEYLITKSEFDDVMAGHSKSREKNLILAVPLNMYGQDFSERDFQEVIFLQRKFKGSYVSIGETNKNEANEKYEQLSGVVPILSSGSKWLGIVIDKHDMIGDAIETVTHNGAIASVRVGVNIIVRSKNRFVSLGCTSNIANDQDIKSTESMCIKWSEDIQRANQG